MNEKIDLAFVFIGGVHQVLHLAPIAAELGRRRPDLGVHCICADAQTAEALQVVADRMDSPMRVTRIAVPMLSRLFVWVTGRSMAGKLPLLAAIRRRAHDARAIVVPERTSAVLRSMGWRGPLIHVRHGAGDRAPASEARLKAFDLIIVPGEKDVERAVAQGVRADRCRVAGYVKLDYLLARPPLPKRIFENDLRTVVYNPHFEASTSSFGIAGDVIGRFRQGEYNLIFAPHVRAVDGLSRRRRHALESLAVPGRIIIDLGSPSLFDTTYLQAADLYLGDMSSQLYEFMVRPRPVAFINTHGVQWRDDPRYAGWHLGEVANGAADVLPTVDRAFKGHADKAAAQERAVAFAFGDYRGSTVRAADILLDFLGLN